MPTEPTHSAPFRLLAHTTYLCTLTPTQCNNLPSILSLNPDKNLPKELLCPNLEKIILYFKEQDSFNIAELIGIAKKRDLKGARLQSIAIVSLGELVPRKETFKLREHVMRAEYRFEEELPQ